MNIENSVTEYVVSIPLGHSTEMVCTVSPAGIANSVSVGLEER